MAEQQEQVFMILVAQMEFGALVSLGVAENPATHEKKRDPQAAQMFIDQLEMLKARTAGNLSERESKALDESLYRVRMLFVETSGKRAGEGG